SPFNPEISMIRAGRIMLKEIENCVRQEINFAVETTLSGQLYLKHIKRWSEEGYMVNLFFLSLSSVEIALERVAQRVAQGGHNIPADVIRRRYARGIEMFNKYYKDRVHAWVLYDSSAGNPKLVDWGENK